MNERTKQTALGYLKRMREVADAEMLYRGIYRDVFVSAPGRINSVCGGRRHCAIGSLWVAAKQPVDRETGDYIGVYASRRKQHLARRPALRAAYDALNEVADEVIDRDYVRENVEASARESVADIEECGALEALFEGTDISHKGLRDVIEEAYWRIEAA